MIDKTMTVIDWNKTSAEIVNLIRGMNPFPAARTTADGRLLKIFTAEKCDMNGEVGTVLSLDDGIVVGCKDGSVRITELQPEGKRKMNAKDFLMGNKIEIGEKLV